MRQLFTAFPLFLFDPRNIVSVYSLYSALLDSFVVKKCIVNGTDKVARILDLWQVPPNCQETIMCAFRPTEANTEDGRFTEVVACLFNGASAKVTVDAIS